jgi:hypothetical protein
VEWRDGVAQGELVAKLVHDWSKEKKHSSHLCHFGASLLVLFWNKFFELLLGWGLAQLINTY